MARRTQIKRLLFAYEGKDRKGQNVRGEITSSSPTLAKAELKRQGITPTKVKLYRASRGGNKKVTTAEICHFARQMATMMSAGVPLIQSFEIVTKGTDNQGMHQLVTNIKNDVESGRSFSESLTNYPRHFDELFCHLVAAGEASGSLEQMLDRIATYKEKSESLKKKIKKALAYPTAVVIIALIVTTILLIYVVPQFQTLFKGFGADLPAFTQMVIDLSAWMQESIGMLIVGIMAFMWCFIQMKQRSKAFANFLDKMILKVPIIGMILHKACIARFARTLATTFAAGVPLVEALDAVAGATGNAVYVSAVKRIKEEVSTGTPINHAMRQSTLFPNMVVQMIAIGEESGSLDGMLNKIATIYEEDVDAAVDGLSSLLEPLIMAILGVLVGGLVIAMYLPIFKMGSVV